MDNLPKNVRLVAYNGAKSELTKPGQPPTPHITEKACDYKKIYSELQYEIRLFLTGMYKCEELNNGFFQYFANKMDWIHMHIKHDRPNRYPMLLFLLMAEQHRLRFCESMARPY